MASGQKNEFLDGSDSEEDQLQTYESDHELRKGGRTAKRPKVDASDDDLSDDEAEQDDGPLLENVPASNNAAGDYTIEAGDDGDSEKTTEKDTKKTKNKVDAAALPDILDAARPLKKNLVVTDEAIRKSGVVYLSRIPPFMKPAKLSVPEEFGYVRRWHARLAERPSAKA